MGANRDGVGLGASDCERLRGGWLAQPVNATTSLAYLGASAVIAHRAADPGTRAHGLALGFAAMVGLVGVGSVAFHGPQPRGAKAMHDLPIIGVVGMAAVTLHSRRRGGTPLLPSLSGRDAATAGALAVAALAAYAGGRTGARTCDPESLLQMHGAWHVLSAAGTVLVARALFPCAGEQ